MGLAEERAGRTVLQGGFSTGQRVKVLAPQPRGRAKAKQPVGGTVGAWVEERSCWEVLVDGAGAQEVPSEHLLLEAESPPSGAVADEGGAACDFKGQQVGDVFRPAPGNLVQAWLDGAWIDAVILELGLEGKTSAEKNVRVVRMADCAEAVVPIARVRRKENFQATARRVEACQLAREKLAKKRVTDADVLEVLRRWGFVPNPMRKNVIPQGENWVYSDTLGLVNSRTFESCTESRLAVVYPEMMKFLGRWLHDNLPKGWESPFPFTSININFAYAARLHRDGRNAGPSVLRSLGNFTGGRLEYFPDDDGKLGIEALQMLPRSRRRFLDASKQFRLISGSRAHSVEDFTGERFSIVFFTCASYVKASTQIRSALVRAGCNWPTKQSMAYFQGLLPKPQGYSGALRQHLARASANGETPHDLRKRKRQEDEAQKENSCPQKEAAAKLFKLVNFPHLGLKLGIGRTYSTPNLVKKCKGDRGKLTALRRKLKDPGTFLPVDS